MYECKFGKGIETMPHAKEIREHVFVREQGFQYEFDEIDRSAVHMVVYENGAPVATGRVFPKEGEEGTWILGRIAVEKANRGKRLGAFVISRLEEYVKEKERPVCFELSAQIQARGFYEKQGYTVFGEEHMEEFCPHVGMRKAV